MEIITNGEWVTCEDGIAKILHIFPKYVEEFDLNINKKVLNEFECYIYIGKVFCDFKGKIKARKFVRVYTSVTKIDGIYIKLLEKSLSENLVQFQKFESVVNEEVRQIFLEYQVDILSESLIKDSFAILKEQLPSDFKWSQMKKIFSPEKIGFDIRDFLKFGYVFSKDPTKKVLTIRLDSTGYKFDNRETLFHRVTIF